MIKYKLGEVVKIRSERVDNPANCSYDKFVGLQHYVSGEIEIKNYGDTSLLKSAMKVFKSGDILIARRNVYLKRASIIMFDGITSGDSIVLYVENELLRKIIPFVLNTDEFWEYAEKFSDGTMSKRLSPKVLLEYEFMLPELDKQEKLAELLWAANNTKEAYKKLLYLTDELVKSKFIEMFGNPIINSKGWNTKLLGELCELKAGKNIKAADIHEEYLDGLYPCYGGNGLRGYVKEYSHEGSINLIGRQGALCGNVKYAKGKFYATEHAVVTQPKVTINSYWLYFVLKELDLNRLSTGAAQPGLTVGRLNEVEIPIVPMELQNQFADFIQQVDKLKFELQDTINNLEKTIKTLMTKNFV